MIEYSTLIKRRDKGKNGLRFRFCALCGSVLTFEAIREGLNRWVLYGILEFIPQIR